MSVRLKDTIFDTVENANNANNANTLDNHDSSYFSSNQQAIPFIVGSTNDTVANWTGSYNRLVYKNGLTIIYVPKVDGAWTSSGGTTLNINGLGPLKCYYNNSSRLTSHFSKNTPIIFTCIQNTDGVFEWKRADYNSDDNYTLYNPKSYKCATALKAYNPVGENLNGELVDIITTPFNPFGNFYIYTSDRAAGGTGTWMGLYRVHYHIRIKQGANYISTTIYKPLYMKGTISNGLFTFHSYTQTLPTTDDNTYVYYYIGETNNTNSSTTSSSYISFSQVHPIFVRRNGSLRLYSGYAEESSYATSLQTSRTLWGQSFNGTANVTGLIKADSGVQIGNTTDIGWYNNGSRITAGNGTARGVNAGSLLISDLWADSNKVPTNGAYIKGNVSIGAESAIAKLHVVGNTYLNGSVSEGDNTKSTGTNSHAEGNFSISSGLASHSEGKSTRAIGNYSHTEGFETECTGYASHAEGCNTNASGKYGAHSEGYNTKAIGDYSHSEGYGTISNNYAQHSLGRYNTEDFAPSPEDYKEEKTAFVIGNGANKSNRSDAFKVLFNGTTYIKGIGDFNGTNPSSQNSIQSVLSSIQSLLNNKLNRDGDTMTGHIYFKDSGKFIDADNTYGIYLQNGSNYVALKSDGEFYKNNSYKFWHENNDGSGSGLDADLLDGYHASHFSVSGHSHSTINITDNRGSERLPDYYSGKTLSTFFNECIPGTSSWQSGITVKGWTDDYASWQLIGGSTTSTNEDWYLRSGINSTWNPVRKIWHDGNLSPVTIDTDQTITGKKTFETGGIIIKGTAASHKFMTRCVIGSDGDTTAGDLYLNYGVSSPVYFGSNGAYYLNHNGVIKAAAIKLNNICIETNNSAELDNKASEINNFNGVLYLQHQSSKNVYIATGGGNVGIGTSSPTAKLDINGDAKISGSITATNYIGKLKDKDGSYLWQFSYGGSGLSSASWLCAFVDRGENSTIEPIEPSNLTVGNSTKAGSLEVHTGRNSEANKIVRTDGSGYIQCGYINSSDGGNEKNNSKPAYIWGTNGEDNYLRTYNTNSILREAYLDWGGKNFSAGYSPLDASMVGELGANRLAFARAAGITIEYSDDGTTWKDYGVSDEQKQALTSRGASLSVGHCYYGWKDERNRQATANDKLRIIINTSLAGIYTTLNKFILYISTDGSNNCTCTIEVANESTPDNYEIVVNKQSIAGWSGWNVINTYDITTYGNSPEYQKGRLRFTFEQTGRTYEGTGGLTIYNLFGFGGMGWSTPSNLAKFGHLYSYDGYQNAYFPADLHSTSIYVSSSYIDGLLSFTPNKVAVDFRPAAEWHSKVEYMTSGNEALVFANKQAATSFIFKCGKDLTATSDWAGSIPTPTMQMKNQSLYINELIPNGTAPSYNFKVNGNFYLGNTSVKNNIIQASSNSGVSDSYALKIIQGTDNGSNSYDSVIISSNDSSTLRLSEADGTQLGFSATDTKSVITSTHDLKIYVGAAKNGIIYTGGGGTQAMEITSTGNIGIGTSTPTSKLHVNGLIKITGGIQIGSTDTESVKLTYDNGSLHISKSIYADGNITAGGIVNESSEIGVTSLSALNDVKLPLPTLLDNGDLLTWDSNMEGGKWVNIHRSSLVPSFAELNYSAAPMKIQNNNSQNLIICAGGGNVGIGNASPIYKLDITGNVHSTLGFYDSSDERLKNFKGDIQIDFNKLKQIPKKYFTWKEDETNKLNIGTSAQEVQKIYPEVVLTDNDGMLSVDYAKLSIVALKAIDQLHDENEKLKAELKNIKEILNKLI